MDALRFSFFRRFLREVTASKIALNARLPPQPFKADTDADSVKLG
jgi:hypothetical protein